MIEINLLPDVKRELLAAQRARTQVISFAILIGIIAVGCVTLLALYAFAFQAVREKVADDAIKEQSAKLKQVSDLSSTLTIQNQLEALPQLNNAKPITSRLFDMLQTTNPSSPNDITISTVTVDTASNVVTIQGQAVNGYSAVETYKKTIAGSNITYNDESGAVQKTPLVQDVTDSGTSYGEDASGQRVLRFTMQLTYDPALFSNTYTNVKVQGPAASNATDSYRRLPESIFSNSATDIKEAK